MKSFNYFLLGWCCIFYFPVLGQEITQFNYGMVKFTLPESPSDEFIDNLPQMLFLRADQLYVLPDGTGRIYKIDLSKKPIQLIRLDSTRVFGTTFGSYNFNYKDTLYSFGGYGFWHFNGQLRVYVPQKGEWEIETLDREIPFSKRGYFVPLFWLDSINGKLWIGYSVDAKESITKVDEEFKSIIDSVFVLDLATKSWRVAGGLTKKVIETANKLSSKNLVASPWGQLIHESENNLIYLLDYEHNRLKKLNENKAKEVLRLTTIKSVLYFKDSSLIIQSGENWLNGNFIFADTVKLSGSDFSDQPDLIYEPQVASILSLPQRLDVYQSGTIGILIGLVITSSVLYFFVTRPLKRRGFKNNGGDDYKPSDLFDEKELEIIRFVAANSKGGIGTTIDQINTLLGVTQKSSEIQKKQRSDIFISINEKWSRSKISQNRVLIDKRRLDHDKRTYEYFIEETNLDKISLFNSPYPAA